MSKWIDNPITWRTYFKLAGIASAISVIGGIIYYMALMGVQISDIGDKVKSIFKKD